MALGGGMSCVKYLLFCFNLLFAITGLIILIVGAQAQISLSPYVELTQENFYMSGPIVFIIVGVIVFVVAFFGCCGAVKENHCMIVTFSVFLLIIFVAELAVGIAGYVKHNEVETTIYHNLMETIKQYPDSKDIQKSFNIIQTDLKCCGIQGPGDWKANNITMPDSCCAGRDMSGGKLEDCTESSATLHTVGCLDALLGFLKSYAAILGGIGLGIAGMQLLGVIFACCLARSIRSQYETV